MNMLQIGILGVAGTLLAVQFKSGKSEYGIYISAALSLIIFSCILGQLTGRGRDRQSVQRPDRRRIEAVRFFRPRSTDNARR